METHTEPKKSTPDVKKSGAIAWIIAAVVFVMLLIVITKIHNRPSKSKENDGGKNNDPIEWSEFHTLKKGNQPDTIHMRDGYKCDYFGKGKKYYHQVPNSEPEIWGGNSKCSTGKGSSNISYALIWFYDDSLTDDTEVVVECKFRKKQSN